MMIGLLLLAVPFRIPQSTISIFSKHRHANKSDFGKQEIPELEINTELQKSICYHFRSQYLPQKNQKILTKSHIQDSKTKWVSRNQTWIPKRNKIQRHNPSQVSLTWAWNMRNWVVKNHDLWRNPHGFWFKWNLNLFHTKAHVGLYIFHWFSWPSFLYFKIQGLWECKIQIACRVKGDERIEIITQTDELRRDGFWPVWLLY